jgi:two-component system sensor histidine kinase BaeS
MRGRFFRRIVVLLGAFFVLAAGALTLLAWLAATTARLVSGPMSAPWVAGLIALALSWGVVAVGRTLRDVADPAGDIMEAAGQLAEGNYDVHVPEHGPPEIRRLARAFNQMAVRLQAHDQQRRNLLADVTHELRTPLSVIQGSLEGLLDGVYPRDDAHLLAALEETRVLSALVDDLRTLALAETGRLPLHRETADLGALLRDTATAFLPRAEAAGVAVAVDVPGDLPSLEIDPVRVRQVLGILLTNALQHTPAGGSIRVAGRADGAGAPAEAVSVSVTDTGSGIAPEDLPRIFDRFYKSPQSKGSGLGLTIARNLVAAHDGRIEAESEPGRGTTIRFTLPRGRSA